MTAYLERVGEQVVEQVVASVAPAQPADEDRRGADQRRRSAAEKDHGDHQRQEAPGDLHLRLGGDRGEVAEHREGQQGRKQAEVPVALWRSPEADAEADGRCWG